jgi:Amt family ammonium transporter
MMFQMTFAIITPALIIGGFAERMKFSAMLLFSGVWLMLVYVPVTHWVWGGGWLGEMGLYDFAGGTVVHITAGVAALVSAIVLGPRRGFPSAGMMPHNMTMTIAGAGMLWVGWFGFNGGSQLAADGGAAMAITVTHISAAAASLSWALWERIKYGKASLVGIVTGTIAGLATITPASGYVGPMAGVILGLAGGLLCYYAVDLIRNRFGVDDSLDVLAVHGVGGALGTLLLVFLIGLPGGTSLAEGQTIFGQFGVQALGVGATALWSGIATFIIIKLCQYTVGLRVDEQSEIEGLDYTSHGETGYNL